MSWETRGDRRYYYRRRKVNGRVVAEYYGAGALGELAASHAQLDRICAERERAAYQRRLKAEATVDRQLADYRHQVLALLATVLQFAGYHQHHRGEWRKKRMAAQTQLVKTDVQAGLNVMSKTVHRLQLSMVTVSEQVQDVILADVARVRTGLGWQSAPAHERMLIEHIGLCWLQLQLVEQQYARQTGNENYNQRIAAHFERRLSMAHHRYLQAVETLARVRKLNLNVQINIGDKQVITGAASQAFAPRGDPAHAEVGASKKV